MDKKEMKRSIASPNMRVKVRNWDSKEIYISLEEFVERNMVNRFIEGGQIEILQQELDHLREITTRLLMNQINHGELNLWQVKQILGVYEMNVV